MSRSWFRHNLLIFPLTWRLLCQMTCLIMIIEKSRRWKVCRSSWDEWGRYQLILSLRAATRRCITVFADRFAVFVYTFFQFCAFKVYSWIYRRSKVRGSISLYSTSSFHVCTRSRKECPVLSTVGQAVISSIARFRKVLELRVLKTSIERPPVILD